MALSYSRRVIEKITKPVWDMLIDAVNDGTITPQHMRDIALEMSCFSSDNSAIYGNHCRRTNNEGRSCDNTELRQILCEFYERSMHSMEGDLPIKSIIKILEHKNIQLKALARDISKVLNKPNSDERADPFVISEAAGSKAGEGW